jgi:hypothetical protein
MLIFHPIPTPKRMLAHTLGGCLKGISGWMGLAIFANGGALSRSNSN